MNALSSLFLLLFWMMAGAEKIYLTKNTWHLLEDDLPYHLITMYHINDIMASIPSGTSICLWNV